MRQFVLEHSRNEQRKDRPHQNVFFVPWRRDKPILHSGAIIQLNQTPEAYNTVFSSGVAGGGGVLPVFLGRIKTDMLMLLNQTSSSEKYSFHDSLKLGTVPLHPPHNFSSSK
jgi:hypothetical protein